MHRLANPRAHLLLYELNFLVTRNYWGLTIIMSPRYYYVASLAGKCGNPQELSVTRIFFCLLRLLMRFYVPTLFSPEELNVSLFVGRIQFILVCIQFTRLSLGKKIKKLIVIEGPTASGKTALAISLAQHFSTVILSADSRQFFNELSIGTAKPTLEEQAGIRHYFIDSHSIHEDVSAARYAREAHSVLEKEFKRHDTLILVGGSGMFIDALCVGLDDIPSSKTLRNALTQEVNERGLQHLLDELLDKDPLFFEQVDRKNPARVIRAIEAMRLTHQSFSSLRTARKQEHSFEILRFVIEHPRERLYDRINRRVDLMMEAGLLEEVKRLVDFQHVSALKTVGYTELFAYLRGEISLDEAIERIKQHSRRYAKRQLTWFKKHPSSHWIAFDDTEKMCRKIFEVIDRGEG